MKRKNIIQFLIIILLGFIPLLWFQPGKTIIGHDSGLPFDPIVHFQDRLFLWSTHFGFGADLNNGLVGSVFVIHGMEAFFRAIGFSVQNVEKLNFIFWFVLPGITMYYTARKLWPGKMYLPIFAASIYMVNYYLLQGWFAAERTKFSLYAAFPIVICCMLSYLLGRMSLKKSILIAGITLGIFNGGGSIPLYGGMFVAIGTIVIYDFVIHQTFHSLLRSVKFLVGIGIVYFLTNAYWIIPYLMYVTSSFSKDLAAVGGTEGTLSWTRYLSEGASFINIFRGQGIPDWYLNPTHAYAGAFLKNPFLIFISLLLPITAYAAEFFTKKKEDKYFIHLFALMSLFSMIFIAATKSQLGFLYTMLVLHVPGFSIFRSAFYKFDYVLWFTYALLIGYTLDFLLNWLEGRIKKHSLRNFISWTAIGIFIIGLLLYHFPVLNGSFFDYSHDDQGRLLTTRVAIPQYIFDFGDWVNRQPDNKRYLILPELSETNYISYTWGYWSLSPISSLLAKNSYVQNNAFYTGNNKILVNKVYDALKRKDLHEFESLRKMLGIDGIVLQEDFDWKNNTWGTTDPQFYKNVLNSDSYFALEKKFGAWEVYSIKSNKESFHISLSNKLQYMQGNLEEITSMPYFDPVGAVFTDTKDTAFFIKEATDIFVAPECDHCTLLDTDPGFVPYNPNILPGSIFYPILAYRENKIKARADDFDSKLNLYLTLSDRRVAEISWMIESKQKLNLLPQAISNYYSVLQEFKQFLNSERSTIGSKQQSDSGRKMFAHLFKQSFLVEKVYLSQYIDKPYRETMSQAYDTVTDLVVTAKGMLWSTNDAITKYYNTDLPEKGTYTIMLNKNTLAYPNDNYKDVTLSFQGKEIMLRPLQQMDEWLSFGDYTFTDKNIHINLFDATARNLLTNLRPVLPQDPKGITVMNGLYSFTKDSQDKCVTYQLLNLEKDAEYRVSFTYRNLTDRKDLAFYISDPDIPNSKLSINEYFLPNNRKWDDRAVVFYPKKTYANILFCNGFSSLEESILKRDTHTDFLQPGQTTIEVQNIALYKVSIPKIVLYKKLKNTKTMDLPVDFKRNSPVSYTVDVKNIFKDKPASLLMRETYNKFWTACTKSNCSTINDEKHFTSSGFANAWYFPRGVAGKIEISYYPQKIYYAGIAVTIISFVSLVIYIIRKRLWKE